VKAGGMGFDRLLREYGERYALPRGRED